MDHLLLINIIVAAITLVPAVILLTHYLKTRIKEYIIFSGFFLSGSIALVVAVMINYLGDLIYFKILYICYTSSILLLFIHALRLRWAKSPVVVKYTGMIWYFILIFLTIFWEPMETREEEYVMFMTMGRTYTSFYPMDAGLVSSNGVLIYSAGHAVLASAFVFFCVSTLIYAYLTTDLVMKNRHSEFVRMLFLVAWGFMLFWSVMYFPAFTEVFPNPNVLLLPSAIIIGYIALMMPEGLLISHGQILRAVNLYKLVENINADRQSDHEVDTLLDYIRQLPEDLIRHNK